MEQKLFIVVRTSDADADEVNVLGIYDNVDAARQCVYDKGGEIIRPHHYPIQSTYDPEYDSEYEDPTDYIGMGWVDSRGRP